MKTTITFADLDRKVTTPTLAGIDALMSTAKATVPADKFPELKLGKTYRFTANVMREYGIRAFEKLERNPLRFVGEKPMTDLAEAYTHLHLMLETDTYDVNAAFATVLRSELYKLRNAVKAIADK